MNLQDLTVGDERASVGRAGSVLGALKSELLRFAREIDGEHAPPVFTGCGSSLDAASIATTGTGVHTRSAGDVGAADRDHLFIAVSRSGHTSELMRAKTEVSLPYVITCDPSAALSDGARGVLDLSSAQDSGFVAAGSTLVTAAAIAVIATPEAERSRTYDRLLETLEALELREAISSGEVIWLSDWALVPLGRELVRKSIETGRYSTWGHPYEFLHGDDVAVSPSAAWVLIDDDSSSRRFLALSRLDERVADLRRIPTPVGPTPIDLIHCLGTAYAMLFRPEAKVSHE